MRLKFKKNCIFHLFDFTFRSKRRETRDRESNEKQWTEMEIDSKKNDSDGSIKSIEEKSLSTTSTPTPEDPTPKIHPVKWTVRNSIPKNRICSQFFDSFLNHIQFFIFQVNEVCDFIRGLPGCADYAEDFAIQEIDGQALMLLKEDHLMSAMSIKLGPALKIVARIDCMKNELMSNSSSPSSNNSS